MPRQPNPDLEGQILDAALRLWARGGEKALTMRGIAKAAGTTTPTVYERYRDRDDILAALRKEARSELFSAVRRTHTLRQAVVKYLEFALENSYAYEVLFDGVGRPPSLYEPWPSFNLIRERLATRLGGTPRKHTRLMLSVWSLMHGTAMLVIRGGFEGALRTQTISACLDAFEAIVEASQSKKMKRSGAAFPGTLILGEGERSRLGNGGRGAGRRPKKH